jgi:hypothetical protein
MAGERLRKALKEYRRRYQKSDRKGRSQVLDEFCELTQYHRKYAIALLHRPVDEEKSGVPRRRGPTYSAQAIRVLERIWEASGYPWSERLKALLPLWLPYAHEHIGGLTPEMEQELLAISPRQIDRRLQSKKRKLKRRLYGRTKPGTLLKHHIPIKTDHWDVTEPGFMETDTVSHSGESASGEFIYSVNLTDVHTGWCETRAVIGRGETGVVSALDAMRHSVPFAVRGLDSDNGSEFLNYHLYRYCEKHHIQFTRSRPYKKNDNAHIEQKNWTHVRRIFGWSRYDNLPVLEAMNDLYRNELRLMMNLFQPSVKLRCKERVGARLHRVYDAPRTPLDRLLTGYVQTSTPKVLQTLRLVREQIDPFALSASIDAKLERIERLRRSDATNRNYSVLEQSSSPRGAHPKKETPYAYPKTQAR